MESQGTAERWNTIRARIDAACGRAGRIPAEVELMAVSKTVSSERIQEAIDAGARVFGENRVQEAAEKIPGLRAANADRPMAWHLIGHLQSNKARRAVELFDVIQSVDSRKLGLRLNELAGELGRRLPVFLEVNLGAEESKAGVEAVEVLPLCEQLAGLANLDLRGLMTVPPFLDDPEQVRPFFRRLREMRDEARANGIVGDAFRDLSMGMSHDFEVAIEEGATLVRIGTALFGERR